MGLWYLPGPDHLFPCGYRFGLCTDSVLEGRMLQFFVQIYFSCIYNITSGVLSGKKFLSSFYLLHSQVLPFFLGASLFCFYLYFPPGRRCQEAEIYPTRFAYHGLNSAVKDFSASNTKYLLLFSKAATRDGVSTAGMLARHSQTNFIVLPARGLWPPR